MSWISLDDVEFRVSEPGRRRCLLEGVRNVHAWVVGTEILRCPADWGFPAGHQRVPSGYRRAVYDPWKGGTFVDSETLEPVLTALHAILSGKDVYYTSRGEL